jgi:tRNA(adenine34) deaminase
VKGKVNMSPVETDEHWMKLAVEEAEKAMQNGEIPVAAILVADGKELSRSQTMVSRKGTMAAHGELFALLEANGKIWSAPHPLVIYTNLEPCLMCVGAAMQVGVDEIVFGMRAAPDGGERYTNAIAEGGQKPPKIRGGVLEMETVALMRQLPEVNPQQPALPYVMAMLEAYKGR